MAEIKTVFSGEITIKKIIGVVTAPELLNSLRDYYAGFITKNVIWDLSEGSVRKLKVDDLRDIVDLIYKNAHTRIEGKTAIFAPTDLEYGMSRMLNTFSELRNIPYESQTFRTLSDAARWLGVACQKTLDATEPAEAQVC